MTRDGGEVMVTGSGDVLLVHANRYLSSPLFVSREFEFDPLHQRASPHGGDPHHRQSQMGTTNDAAPL